MRLKLKVITGGASNTMAIDPTNRYEMPFYIIGSDQSMSRNATQVNEVDLYLENVSTLSLTLKVYRIAVV